MTPPDGIDAEVHQAEGMVAAQAEVPLDEARRLMHEYAETHGMNIHGVASLVLDRVVRFDS